MKTSKVTDQLCQQVYDIAKQPLHAVYVLSELLAQPELTYAVWREWKHSTRHSKLRARRALERVETELRTKAELADLDTTAKWLEGVRQ